MFNLNSGYVGSKMSVRAEEAYSSGEMPLSKWKKSDILCEIFYLDTKIDKLDFEKISLKNLKDLFLYKSSWHHTGSFFNETNFYTLDSAKVENFTKEDFLKIIKKQTENTINHVEEEELKYAVIKVEVWSGSFRKPKLIGEEKVTGILKNNKVYYSTGKFYRTDANKTIFTKSFNSYCDLTKEFPEFKKTKKELNKIMKFLK